MPTDLHLPHASQRPTQDLSVLTPESVWGIRSSWQQPETSTPTTTQVWDRRKSAAGGPRQSAARATRTRATSAASRFSGEAAQDVFADKAARQKRAMLLCGTILLVSLPLLPSIIWFRVQHKDYIALELLPVHWSCTLLQCTLEFTPTVALPLKPACMGVKKVLKEARLDIVAEIDVFLKEPCTGTPKVFPLLEMSKRCSADDKTGTTVIMGEACEKGYWSAVVIVSMLFIGMLTASTVCCLIALCRLAVTMELFGANSAARQAQLVKRPGTIPSIMACSALCIIVACLAYACMNCVIGDMLMQRTFLGFAIKAPRWVDGFSPLVRLLLPGWGWLVYLAIGLLHALLGRIIGGLMKGAKGAREPATRPTSYCDAVEMQHVATLSKEQQPPASGQPRCSSPYELHRSTATNVQPPVMHNERSQQSGRQGCRFKSDYELASSGVGNQYH